MDLSDLERRLARHFEDTAAPGVISVYLFGSQALGRAHRQSDVDIGVLLSRASHPSAKDRFEERVRLTSELIGALHVNAVDVVVLNDAPPVLGRSIVTTGRRLVCVDPVADHAFVRDVQLRAADLAPFLRRTRRTKLAALS